MQDLISKEMDSAFALRQSDPDVTRVVDKYFPIGMTTDQTTIRLNLLKQAGFQIGEYRYEGAREWPDGELKPYRDEETRRNFQNRYPKGIVVYAADKVYAKRYLVLTKTASIKITIKDGLLAEARGSVWSSGI